MKIAAYTMFKNEMANAEAYMRSCRDVDGVFLLDTGSTDGSAARLAECGAVINRAAIRPWRFDLARNIALSMVPADYDACIKLDLDERLEGNWRGEFERLWTPETTRASYTYVWSWFANGKPDVSFRSNLIHSRFCCTWRFPTHESLWEKGQPQYAVLERLRIHHLRIDKERPDDLPLLRLGVDENPTSPRCLFMLGRELTTRRQYSEAVEVFERYLRMPDAKWVNERAAAMLYVSKCYSNRGNKSAALQWAYRAAGEDPSRRENWLEVAWLANGLQEWMQAYAACKLAFNITEPSREYINRGFAWGVFPWEMLAIAAEGLGYSQEAAFACREGLNLAPECARLIQLRDRLS